MLHHPRGEVRHGRLSSETNITDLVRLLRETEEGRGLGLSYSEALGKAMGDDFEETTVTRRIIRRGLTLLAKAPSLGRKRYGLDGGFDFCSLSYAVYWEYVERCFKRRHHF